MVALQQVAAAVQVIQDCMATGDTTEFVEQVILAAAARRLREEDPSYGSTKPDPTTYEQAMARPAPPWHRLTVTATAWGGWWHLRMPTTWLCET